MDHRPLVCDLHRTHLIQVAACPAKKNLYSFSYSEIDTMRYFSLLVCLLPLSSSSAFVPPSTSSPAATLPLSSPTKSHTLPSRTSLTNAASSVPSGGAAASPEEVGATIPNEVFNLVKSVGPVARGDYKIVPQRKAQNHFPLFHLRSSLGSISLSLSSSSLHRPFIRLSAPES